MSDFLGAHSAVFDQRDKLGDIFSWLEKIRRQGKHAAAVTFFADGAGHVGVFPPLSDTPDATRNFGSLEVCERLLANLYQVGFMP